MFGSGGTVQLAAGDNPETTETAMEGNGNMLVGPGLYSQFAVARFLPSGALDTTFGTDRIAQAPLPVGGQVGPIEIPSSIGLEPDKAIMERRQ